MCLIFCSDLFLSFIFLNIWCVFGVTYVMTERIISGKAIWIHRVLNSLYCCTIGFNYLFIFTTKNEIWNHGQMLLNMTSRIQMQDFFFDQFWYQSHIWLEFTVSDHWLSDCIEFPPCCVQFMTPRWCNWLRINILCLLFSRRHTDSRTLV